jgi:CBS domain-containing protein
MTTLLQTRVDGLMQTNLVTVSPDATVRSLTRLLSDHQISGAPVVDHSGQVVGVVSATDILRLAADETDVRVGSFPPISPMESDEPSGDDELDLVGYFASMDATVVAPEGIDWISEDAFNERTVRDIMTGIHFSVGPDASLAELADLMVRGRIHRALVVENGELRGIVTTFDVLKAISSA